MPAEKNTLLRVLVPIVLIIGAIAFSVAFLNSARNRPSQRQADRAESSASAGSNGAATSGEAENLPPRDETATEAEPAATEGAPGASGGEHAGVEAEPSGVAPESPDEYQTKARPALRARTWDRSAVPSPETLGSLDPASGYRLRVELSLLGAGLEEVTTTEFFATINDKLRRNPEGHYVIQERAAFPPTANNNLSATPLGARAVDIDGTLIDLYGETLRPVWRPTAPGAFECIIEDDAGAAVARIERRYSLQPGSFELVVEQRFENLSGHELKVVWYQYAAADLSEELKGYRLPTQRVRFGHLLDARRDPTRTFVEADDRLLLRDKVIEEACAEQGIQARPKDHRRPGSWVAVTPLWPDAPKFKGAGELVWVAQTSRYFVTAVHGRYQAGSGASKAFQHGNAVHALVMAAPDDRLDRVVLQTTSPKITVPAGQSADLSFAAYIGPLSRAHLSPKVDPVYGELGLRNAVIYNVGGMCAWCTFQWLARLLIDFLHLLHAITHDWALSIMLLVVCVRSLLHPITKRSQIAMTRFGKQMQALAPKQKKLQEKYRDNPKQLQAEMARLMREEGVSYKGMFGCLPIFLQSPIWIALYAMLYFAFDLRHEEAFFGLVQAVTGDRWMFLADLSSPDHFIEFGGWSFNIPLIGALMGPISGINILPLLLGIIFYFHQKYLSPPTTNLSPEQQQAQQISKIMSVVLFPVFMYNAPSGLCVYFLTNSCLGIVESKWIRAHINQLDLEPKKKEPGEADRKKVENTAEGRPRNPFLKEREKKRFKKR